MKENRMENTRHAMQDFEDEAERIVNEMPDFEEIIKTEMLQKNIESILSRVEL